MMGRDNLKNSNQFTFLGRIGIEFDHANLILKSKLNEALPKSTEFQDIGEMTMKMRMVKSSEELGKFTSPSFLFASNVWGASKSFFVLLSSTSSSVRLFLKIKDLMFSLGLEGFYGFPLAISHGFAWLFSISGFRFPVFGFWFSVSGFRIHISQL